MTINVMTGRARRMSIPLLLMLVMLAMLMMKLI
jgi:hypothetical protein